MIIKIELIKIKKGGNYTSQPNSSNNNNNNNTGSSSNNNGTNGSASGGGSGSGSGGGGGLIPTKLYVTNFPFTCTQRQIQDLFSQFGQVVECTLKKDYYAYILYTSCKSAFNAYKNANGYKMFGRKLTVHLATSKKSQSHLTTSPIVPPAAFFSNSSSSSTSAGGSSTSPTGTSSSTTVATTTGTNGDVGSTSSGEQIPKIVHVRNFPETCSQQQIRDVFAQYGDIVECLILHDSYAFVHFKSPLDARLALQSTNNKPFFASNTPLLVQYSRSKFKQVQPQSQQQTSTTSSGTNPQNSGGYGPSSQMSSVSSSNADPSSRRPSNFRKPVFIYIFNFLNLFLKLNYINLKTRIRFIGLFFFFCLNRFLN